MQLPYRVVSPRRREWPAVVNSHRGSKAVSDLESDKTVETGASGAGPGGSQRGQHPCEGVWPNGANAEVVQLLSEFCCRFAVFCAVKRDEENQ
jgi:hypothetical protein